MIFYSSFAFLVVRFPNLFWLQLAQVTWMFSVFCCCEAILVFDNFSNSPVFFLQLVLKLHFPSFHCMLLSTLSLEIFFLIWFLWIIVLYSFVICCFLLFFHVWTYLVIELKSVSAQHVFQLNTYVFDFVKISSCLKRVFLPVLYCPRVYGLILMVLNDLIHSTRSYFQPSFLVSFLSVWSLQFILSVILLLMNCLVWKV